MRYKVSLVIRSYNNVYTDKLFITNASNVRQAEEKALMHYNRFNDIIIRNTEIDYGKEKEIKRRAHATNANSLLV